MVFFDLKFWLHVKTKLLRVPAECGPCSSGSKCVKYPKNAFFSTKV